MIDQVIKPMRVKLTGFINRVLWAIYDWVHRPTLAQEGQTPQDPAKDGAPSPDPKRPAPEDGPPDLDELWKDFNRRLGGLFGGNSKDPSSNSPPKIAPPPEPSDSSSANMGGNNKKPTDIGGMAQDWLKRNMNNGGSGGTGKKGGFGLPNIGFGIIILVIFVIWLFSGIFIVQEGQAGIVLQFGKYKYTTRPGINWRLPYPVQAHEIVNVSNAVSYTHLTLPTICSV